MSNKRPAECEIAHSKRSNFVMREKQNDRSPIFAGSANCAEQPMDLTKKSTGSVRASNSNGLSGALSRDGPPVINIDSEEEASDDISREKLIKKLQDELRNEETKLIFLKQLRYNQCRRHPSNTQSQAPSHSTAHNYGQSRPAHTANGPSKQHGSLAVNNVQAHGGSHPPSSHVRGSQSQVSVQNQAQKRPLPSATVGASAARSTGHVQSHGHHANNVASSHPPSTASVSASKQNQSTPSTTGVSSHQQSSHTPQTPTTQPSGPPKPTTLDEPQKQAARGALRRQLEKTLLAIPPPKSLPPELSFIPSLMSQDFVKLLGLEEVVKMLLDIQRQEKRDVKYVFNPFRCSQCRSDFTPVWKREKPGSKNVICEQCVTSNQKRSLRQEHTARLKGAFLKAAEQQQELEEQLKKGHIPSSLVPMMPVALQPHHTSHSTPSTQGSGATSSRQQHHQSQQQHQQQQSASSAHSAQIPPAHQAAANAAAAAVPNMLPHQLAAAASMTSPQSLLGMAYLQQQLAAMTGQQNQALGGFGDLSSASAAVAAAAAALAPNQRQMLLQQLSQQAAKSFGWKS